MSTGDLLAFHAGIVVEDIDATIDRYRRMLGFDRWHVMDASIGRVAYGGRDGMGMAFELIQPGDAGPMADFLREHGEGVQHIGIWTPDLRGALEKAVAEGGKITRGAFRQEGTAVVQVAPAPGSTGLNLAFLDTGLSSVSIELIGHGTDDFLRNWLGLDFERILPAPPW